jgi:hypothetical protein
MMTRDDIITRLQHEPRSIFEESILAVITAQDAEIDRLKARNKALAATLQSSTAVLKMHIESGERTE